MSADSPRRTSGNASRGMVAVPSIVPPQVVSDRSILDSAIGFINEVTLAHQPHTDPKDTITWARFETAADISDPRFGEDWELEGNVSPPLLLILGYGLGVQVWAIPANGEAVEVLSWRHGIVSALRVLPTPSSSVAIEENGRADEPTDAYAEKRPLIALVDGSASSGAQPQFCAVNFISLKTGTQVKAIKFKNPVIDVLANRLSIVITFHERIAVFDARTLEDRLSITTCYPSPGINPNPVALGPRWLAYAEHKLLHSKRSGGGCDGEGVASYTATVLNASKSLVKGLRELGEQVAAGLTGTSGSATSSKNTSFDSGTGPDSKQSGIVTIIDIKNSLRDFSPTSGVPMSSAQTAGTDPVIAHFIAHSEALVAMEFDNSGMLLVTADRRGHDFHVFRLQPNPVGPSLAAVHHLYVLHRGDTSAKVQNISFSLDSRWVAVSTLRGTTHVFPITPYGGPMGVRTHTSLHVVNKLSRFHRSAGLSAEGRSSSPISHSESTTFSLSLQPYHNTTLPPYPRPTVVMPLAQLRQPFALGSPPGSATLAGAKTGTGGQGSGSQRQRLSSLSDDSGKPLSVCAIFAKSRSWLLDPPNVTREAPHRMQRKAVDSLFVMAGHGALIQYDLDTKLASNVAKEKICDDTPIELEVEAKAQWNLGRRKEGSQEIVPPLSLDNWLVKSRNSCMLTDSTRQYDDSDDRGESWLAQVEIVTHAGPHRRLWMGPQFVFKTYNTPSGSNLSHVDIEAVEIGTNTTTTKSTTSTTKPEHSSPLNMPLTAAGRSSAVPVLIESGSYSSIEQSPKLMDRFRHDHLDSDYAVAHGDTRLKEDLADAMRESPSVSAASKESGRGCETGCSNDNIAFYDALAEHDDQDQDPDFLHDRHASAAALASALPNIHSYDTSSSYESIESLKKPKASIEKIVNPLGTVTTVTSCLSAEVKTDILDEVVSQLAAEDTVIHENCDESLFRPVVAIFCDEKTRLKHVEDARKTQELCQPPENISTKLVVPVIAKEDDDALTKKEKQKNVSKLRNLQSNDNVMARERIRFEELSSLNKKSKVTAIASKEQIKLDAAKERASDISTDQLSKASLAKELPEIKTCTAKESEQISVESKTKITKESEKKSLKKCEIKSDLEKCSAAKNQTKEREHSKVVTVMESETIKQSGKESAKIDDHLATNISEKEITKCSVTLAKSKNAPLAKEQEKESTKSKAAIMTKEIENKSKQMSASVESDVQSTKPASKMVVKKERKSEEKEFIEPGNISVKQTEREASPKLSTNKKSTKAAAPDESEEKPIEFLRMTPALEEKVVTQKPLSKKEQKKQLQQQKLKEEVKASEIQQQTKMSEKENVITEQPKAALKTEEVKTATDKEAAKAKLENSNKEEPKIKTSSMTAVESTKKPEQKIATESEDRKYEDTFTDKPTATINKKQNPIDKTAIKEEEHDSSIKIKQETTKPAKVEAKSIIKTEQLNVKDLADSLIELKDNDDDSEVAKKVAEDLEEMKEPELAITPPLQTVDIFTAPAKPSKKNKKKGNKSGSSSENEEIVEVTKPSLKAKSQKEESSKQRSSTSSEDSYTDLADSLLERKEHDLQETMFISFAQIEERKKSKEKQGALQEGNKLETKTEPEQEENKKESKDRIESETRSQKSSSVESREKVVETKEYTAEPKEEEKKLADKVTLKQQNSEEKGSLKQRNEKATSKDEKEVENKIPVKEPVAIKENTVSRKENNESKNKSDTKTDAESIEKTKISEKVKKNENKDIEKIATVKSVEISSNVKESEKDKIGALTITTQKENKKVLKTTEKLKDTPESFKEKSVSVNKTTDKETKSKTVTKTITKETCETTDTSKEDDEMKITKNKSSDHELKESLDNAEKSTKTAAALKMTSEKEKSEIKSREAPTAESGKTQTKTAIKEKAAESKRTIVENTESEETAKSNVTIAANAKNPAEEDKSSKKQTAADLFKSQNLADTKLAKEKVKLEDEQTKIAFTEPAKVIDASEKKKETLDTPSSSFKTKITPPSSPKKKDNSVCKKDASKPETSISNQTPLEDTKKNKTDETPEVKQTTTWASISKQVDNSENQMKKEEEYKIKATESLSNDSIDSVKSIKTPPTSKKTLEKTAMTAAINLPAPLPMTSAWKTLSGADMIAKNLNKQETKADNSTFPSLATASKTSKLSPSEKLLPELPTPKEIKEPVNLAKPVPKKSKNPTTLDDFPIFKPLDALPPLPTLEPLELLSDIKTGTIKDISLINFESPLQENPALERKITPPPRGFTEQNLIFALCGSLHYENEQRSRVTPERIDISPTTPSSSNRSSSALEEPSMADYKSLTENDDPYISLEQSSQDTNTTNTNTTNDKFSSSTNSSGTEEIIIMEEKKMTKKQKRKRQQQLLELQKQKEQQLQQQHHHTPELDDDELKPLIAMSESQIETIADIAGNMEPVLPSLLDESFSMKPLITKSNTLNYSTTTDSEGPMPATTSDDNVFTMPSKVSHSQHKIKTKKLEHKINLIAAIEAATSSSTSSAEESGVELGGGGRMHDADEQPPLSPSTLISTAGLAAAVTASLHPLSGVVAAGGAAGLAPVALSSTVGGLKKKTKRHYQFKKNQGNDNVDGMDKLKNKLNRRKSSNDINNSNHDSNTTNTTTTITKTKLGERKTLQMSQDGTQQQPPPPKQQQLQQQPPTNETHNSIYELKQQQQYLTHNAVDNCFDHMDMDNVTLKTSGNAGTHVASNNEAATIVNIDIFDDQLSTSSISNTSRFSCETAPLTTTTPPISLNGVIDTNLMHFSQNTTTGTATTSGSSKRAKDETRSASKAGSSSSHNDNNRTTYRRAGRIAKASDNVDDDDWNNADDDDEEDDDNSSNGSAGSL